MLIRLAILLALGTTSSAVSAPLLKECTVRDVLWTGFLISCDRERYMGSAWPDPGAPRFVGYLVSRMAVDAPSDYLMVVLPGTGKSGEPLRFHEGDALNCEIAADVAVCKPPPI